MIYIIYGMIYLGSALMVYNIYCFIKYVHRVLDEKTEKKEKRFFYIPIILLILFLLGYLAVGIFGKPDIIVSGILFGGSIFVFIMYRVLYQITKQIQKQEHLKSELIAVEESHKAKTQFLSSVSHEMRTPLNVIIGQNTIALQNKNLDEDTKAHLEKIGLNAKQLLGLVNNILDINTIETGDFVIKNDEFVFTEMIELINSTMETACSNKGLTYEHRCDESISGNYIGDEIRYKQIIFNLLDNAVKYTNSPGTISFFVEKANGDENKIRFIVKDTGVGISEEMQSKLFDSFTKEDSSATSVYGGSGLGLTVTKSIVDKLNGEISVESKKGVGSTFTLIIPIKKANKDEEEKVSLEGKRVLIVEDILENAEIVADLLELEGIESDHAINGQIAIDMFSSSQKGYYDLILMDLRMPVMDGLTSTRKIRKLNREDAKTIPIIALSANAFDVDIRESLNAGMNAHLSKPADSDLLYSTLRRWLSNSSKKGEQK